MPTSPTTPFANLQQSWLSAFGVPATFYPQSLNDSSNPVLTSVDITGVIVAPPLMEELDPQDGTKVVYFKVQWWALDPSPIFGDIVQVNTFHYDVLDVQVDRIGGAVLKMRLNDTL